MHSLIIISGIIDDKLILHFALLFDSLHFLLSFICTILYSSLLIFNQSFS